jgi:hypothetical protein
MTYLGRSQNNTPMLRYLIVFLFSSTLMAQHTPLGIPIAIDLPPGWVVNADNYGVTYLQNTQTQMQLFISEHGWKDAQTLQANLAQGWVEEGLEFRLKEDIQTLNATSYKVHYSGWGGGTALEAVGIAGLSSVWGVGGVMVLALVPQEQYQPSIAAAVQAVYKGIRYLPPMDAKAQQWVAALKGKKLVNYDSYYTGTSGVGGYASAGYSEINTLHLCANGHYAYGSNLETTMGGSGTGIGQTSQNQNNDYGYWTLRNMNNLPVLRRVSQTGEVAYFPIEYGQEGYVFLNGTKYAMGSSELCN